MRSFQFIRIDNN